MSKKTLRIVTPIGNRVLHEVQADEDRIVQAAKHAEKEGHSIRWLEHGAGLEILLCLDREREMISRELQNHRGAK